MVIDGAAATLEFRALSILDLTEFGGYALIDVMECLSQACCGADA